MLSSPQVPGRRLCRRPSATHVILAGFLSDKEHYVNLDTLCAVFAQSVKAGERVHRSPDSLADLGFCSRYWRADWASNAVGSVKWIESMD